MERSGIAVEERHIHFPAAAFVVGVAVEGDLDLPVALGNGRIADLLVKKRDRHKLALELHPFLMRNQLGLGVVLNVHVVHRQIRLAARDDLLKNACAQRVKVQRTGIGVRHLHLDTAAQRDGRIELLHLRERHRSIRIPNADLIVAVVIFGKRGASILNFNILTTFFNSSATANGVPVHLIAFRFESNVFSHGIRVILPLKAVQKCILLILAHLVKADDQRPRQGTVHLSVRHTGLDDGRTVLQRVSACCTRGRQKRTDLRQQQHRQQARQQTLQFFPCHNSFLLSFFSPEQQPVPIRLVFRHE